MKGPGWGLRLGGQFCKGDYGAANALLRRMLSDMAAQDDGRFDGSGSTKDA